MKLISMTDFVLEQDTKWSYKNTIVSIRDYANLLKQPLELWMFVPCLLTGGKNVVLEEPTRYSNDEYDTIEVQLYNEAKERCLFEGFEYSETHVNGIDNNLNLFIFPYSNNRFGLTKKNESFRTWFKLFTIEDLVQCDLQLSQTAIKQLGL